MKILIIEDERNLSDSIVALSLIHILQGTTVVKSSTSRGSCVIDVYFKWGLDIYALKTQLEKMCIRDRFTSAPVGLLDMTM